MHTYLSLISPCDEFKLCTDWWICAWCVIVWADLYGVISLLTCLYRLKLKNNESTAFKRPEQMSDADMDSNPSISFLRKIFKQASIFSSYDEIKKNNFSNLLKKKKNYSLLLYFFIKLFCIYQYLFLCFLKKLKSCWKILL